VNATRSRAPSILFYDGSCAFCNSSVQFVLTHERRHTLQFASLQSAFAQRTLERRPDLRSTDSMIVADLDLKSEVESFHIKSSAGLRLAGYMGGVWSLLVVFWIVPKPLRDWVYDLIARHRHRIVDGDHCVVFSDDQLHRVLDA